jgi:hypothetical protein
VTAFDIVILVLLVTWFLVSIGGQIHSKRISRIRRHDLFNLIPLWTFFAPNPGTSDYHVLYREKARDGSISAWSEIPLTHKRSWIAALWNPMKRETKVLADIVNSVAILIEYHREQKTPPSTVGDAVMLSTPYLILMNIVVTRVGRSATTEQRQFALVESHGFDSRDLPAVILCSPYHALASHASASERHAEPLAI